MSGKGEYGEPCEIVDVMREMVREKRCAAALSGISDPEKFMEDVRELVGVLLDHAECGCCEERALGLGRVLGPRRDLAKEAMNDVRDTD